MDCRLLAKGNFLRKFSTSTLLSLYKQKIVEVTAPTHFGSGEKAGGSQFIFATQLMLEVNLGFTISSLDIENAFNEVE